MPMVFALPLRVPLSYKHRSPTNLHPCTADTGTWGRGKAILVLAACKINGILFKKNISALCSPPAKYIRRSRVEGDAASNQSISHAGRPAHQAQNSTQRGLSKKPRKWLKSDPLQATAVTPGCAANLDLGRNRAFSCSERSGCIPNPRTHATLGERLVT